jgi:anaerobic selenocysteine-containing dehydrogenase
MSECVARTERSYCRICTSLCGIVVDIEGEQVVRVRGDRDHPVTHGYMCPKGRALPKMHHHPQRLERPLIRAGGSLRPTSWDSCLDDLSTRLRSVIDRHGPASVGIFFGSGVGMDAAGYRMAQALHAAIGTPARFSPLTIDGTAKTLVASLVGGFPGLSPRPDYENINLVIYIGINPMVSHGHTIAMPNPAMTIRATARRGEVWVIDPLYTETAGFASRHVAPRPGTDYAILAYLVREVLREGADQEVLARSTVDGDVLRTAVEPFNREHAADIAGIDPDDLTTLLASVRKAGRVAVETGTGVTMSVGANLTQWLAWVLMIVTGSMNRRGGVWFHPGFLNQLDGGDLPVITDIFGPGPKSRPELRSIVGDWPCAALPDEINAGNIRAFINLGGSLIRCFPDANVLRPALQRLDVLATLEIIENETTALSTHILPTKDQLERPDLALWDFLSPRVNAQYTPAAVNPVGERRSTWWVLAELMRRLGHEPPGSVPADDRAEGADNAMLAVLTERARCKFSDLVEQGYAETGHEFPAPWIDAHIERLGGWKLAPSALVEQLVSVSNAQSGDRRSPKTLSLIPRRQRRHLNAQFLFLGSPADVLLHPTDAASAGVIDGQQVIVRSARGEIVGTAHVDTSIRPGVVSVPHGHEHANVNYLTSTQEVDPVTGMARYSGIQVSVHPIPAAFQAPGSPAQSTVAIA